MLPYVYQYNLSIILIIFIHMYVACRLYKILMVIKIPAYFLQNKENFSICSIIKFFMLNYIVYKYSPNFKC